MPRVRASGFGIRDSGLGTQVLGTCGDVWKSAEPTQGSFHDKIFVKMTC
jgi:hypothetical protein